MLGYPDQALQRGHEALTFAQASSRILSALTYALTFAAWVHQYRREGQATHARAEALMCPCGGARVRVLFGDRERCTAGLGAGRAGTERVKGWPRCAQGLAACRATGAEVDRAYFLASAGRGVWGKSNRYEEGLRVLAEALGFAWTNTAAP